MAKEENLRVATEVARQIGMTLFLTEESGAFLEPVTYIPYSIDE